MSARLKLKNLKREIERIRTRDKVREYESRLVQLKCHRLLEQNIQEIGACAELYPCDMMRDAVNCLDYNVRKVADSIVRKYSEELAEYIRNRLTTKYALKTYSAFGVRLLAPALNENHIKIDIKE